MEDQPESQEIDNGSCDDLFRIEKSNSPLGGFGLKANQFIPPGKVILTEEACLVGPSTPYACIECLAAVISTNDNKCSYCGHPMCKPCQNDIIRGNQIDLESPLDDVRWHTRWECDVLTYISKICQGKNGNSSDNKNQRVDNNESMPNECEIDENHNLVKISSNTTEGLYNIVFPLRFMALKKRRPDMYRQLLELESHLKERKLQGEASYKSLQDMADILMKGTKNFDGKTKGHKRDLNIKAEVKSKKGSKEMTAESWSREEIEKLIAIQFTNGFEINVVDVCGRALYPTISRINHSCIPSISHANVKKNGANSALAQSLEENKMSVALSPLATLQSNNPALSKQTNRTDGKNNTQSFHKNRVYMELTTQRAIPKDSELSIRYTSAFEGFTSRQTTFMKEWFFQCKCQRCCDGSEFGTFTSSIKCIDCFKTSVQRESSRENNAPNAKNTGYLMPSICLSKIDKAKTERKSAATTTNSTENIYYTRDGNSYLIENNLQCSNKNCLGNTMPNFDSKNHQRLYAAATQMQEDVRRHILKDSPHGEQLLELINICQNSLHEKHSLVMSLKERFVARPTKCIEHLKLQEKYTYELLEYLEALDPGRTWTKDQLLQNLQGVIIKKAHGMASNITNDDKDGIDTMKRSLQLAKDLQDVMVKWNIKK